MPRRWTARRWGVAITAIGVNKSADRFIVADVDEIRRRGEAGSAGRTPTWDCQALPRNGAEPAADRGASSGEHTTAADHRGTRGQDHVGASEFSHDRYLPAIRSMIHEPRWVQTSRGAGAPSRTPGSLHRRRTLWRSGRVMSSGSTVCGRRSPILRSPTSARHNRRSLP